MAFFRNSLMAVALTATTLLSGCVTSAYIGQTFEKPEARLLFNALGYQFASEIPGATVTLVPAPGKRFLMLAMKATNSGTEATTVSMDDINLHFPDGQDYIPIVKLIGMGGSDQRDGNRPFTVKVNPGTKEQLWVLYYLVPDKLIPVSLTVLGETKPVPPPAK